MNNTFAIVYARSGTEQLRELVELRSISALPIGGRYRMIDIILSNLTNSGVRSVGIITQRNYKSLMDHIGSGKEWGLSKKIGGLLMLPPYDLATSRSLYRGLPDALFDKRDFIEHQRWEYCLLTATDKVYRQNFNAMMDKHIESGADVTVLCSSDPRLMFDDSGSTAFFEMKGDFAVDLVSSPNAGSNLRANMGACLMKKELLLSLVEDACAEGRYDFDMDVLKHATHDYKVAAVEHEGYVGPITSVKSYFDLNQDMLDKDVRYDLFNPDFPVYTKTMDAPPTKFERGCDVEHSLFGNGCFIKGHVKNSIVFRGVHIEEGANVENCIIMQNTRIGADAKLRNMIIDKDVVVEAGARCVSVPYDPAIIRKGAVVEGSAR